MDEKLSDREITNVMNKLREQYDKYAGLYGESFFNRKSFEERYIQAIRKGMDLSAFAYAEISLFEDLRKKLEKKQEEHRIKTEKPFTKKVEKYIEELEDQWQEYPCLFSSSEISDEAQHLCGALQEFCNKYWLSISPVINKEVVTELREYNELTDSMQKSFLSTRDRLPYNVENYIFNLNRHGIERADMIFLKDTSGLLKNVLQYMTRIQKITGERVDSFDNRKKRELEEMLQTEKITAIIEYADQIIKNFRFANLI